MISRPNLVSLGGFALISLLGAEAFACRCSEKIRNPAKEAEIAFWGTVESIEHKGAIDKVQFRVDQLHRGSDKEVVQVWASRYEHDCGIRFEQDKKYVVYAYSFYPRGVATSQCWSTYQADDAPTESQFRDPETEIRKPFALETKVRVMAKRIVSRCSQQTRLKDAGWAMILSPGGDPVAPPLEGAIPPREKEFRDCIIQGYLADDETPRPETPVRMEGYYQGGDPNLPSLVDQLDCGQDCPTWESQVRTALLTPLRHDDAAFLVAARNTCLKEGVDAAVSQLSEGRAVGTAEQQRRDAMLLACAASRGEFERAAEYADAAPNEQYLAAVEWLKSRQPQDVRFPIRDDGPTFPDFWFEANKKKPSLGGHRVLRTAFLEHPLWAIHPLFLEAFAEAVLADPEANEGMRDLAALAYHRAARILPESADQYSALAREASDSTEARALATQLEAQFAAAAPPPEPEPEVEDVASEEQEYVEETDNSGAIPADAMWYILAGVVVLVLAAGAFQRFKK